MNEPTLRLAATTAMLSSKGSAASRYPFHKMSKHNKGQDPTVRLATVPGKDSQGGNTLKGQRGVPQITPACAPALLVSYFYLKPFLANQSQYCYRDWVMDSGAFSAHASGVAIDLDEYIACCKKLLKTDKTLTEVFALDVIGDAAASKINCEKMWAAGVPAIPCYHYGSPESALMEMAAKYPKIAIGGCARMKGGAKMEFARQCFARVWPKKIHGFGFGSEKAIMTLPFHSVDATNWEMGPCAFGNWQQFGKMSVRGSNQDLRGEVAHYLAIEERARLRWRKEMKQLEAIGSPTVRLATKTDSRPSVGIALGLTPPSLRLAADPASGSGKRLKDALRKK